MVHLASIPNDSEKDKGLVDGMSKVQMKEDEQDAYTSSVYGSRFASQDMPEHEMAENEMPKEVAYRMIKDHLSLDGNPMLKYALCIILNNCGC